MSELVWISISGLARMVRAKEVSPVADACHRLTDWHARRPPLA